jgi:hypothetical protein
VAALEAEEMSLSPAVLELPWLRRAPQASWARNGHKIGPRDYVWDDPLDSQHDGNSAEEYYKHQEEDQLPYP